MSVIGPCTEFMLDGKKREVSVIISPLKVNQDDNSLKVISGCNYWKACQNLGCQFSLIARGRKEA